MAEVPEVETLVRDLREAVVGRSILETEVLAPSAVRFPTVVRPTWCERWRKSATTCTVYLTKDCTPTCMVAAG